MKPLTKILAIRISDETAALHTAMILAHLASAALLILALSAVSRMCKTPAEILIGTLAAVAAALGLTACGLILGVLAEVRRRADD